VVSRGGYQKDAAHALILNWTRAPRKTGDGTPRAIESLSKQQIRGLPGNWQGDQAQSLRFSVNAWHVLAGGGKMACGIGRSRKPIQAVTSGDS